MNRLKNTDLDIIRVHQNNDVLRKLIKTYMIKYDLTLDDPDCIEEICKEITSLFAKGGD